jgi:hypothetical protein
MSPDRILVAMPKVLQDFPERFAGCADVVCLDRRPTAQEADRFVTGLDTLFCIETPYDWSLLARARARQVTTILRINYEYLPDPLTVAPDMLIAPIAWYQPDGAVILPFPVDRARFPFRKRTRAHTFLHVAGSHGESGRNGTSELLEAIPLVRSEVRFVIYSQRPLPRMDDARVDVRIGDFPDNAALYAEGDVCVLPRRYGGQSLPMNEALSVGMPVMMIDMRPQSAFLPKPLLIPYQRLESIRLDRTVESAAIDPAAIAAKIDEWAYRDISAFSEWADAHAQSMSWDTLRPRYEDLCRGGARRRKHLLSGARA